MKTNRREIPNQVLPFIWLFMKKYKYTFITYLFYSIFIYEIGYFILQPYFIKVFVDGLSANTLTPLKGILIIVAYALSDLFFISDTITNYLRLNSVEKAIEDIRAKLFTHSLRQSTNFFNSKHSGTLASRISIIINNITPTIMMFLYIIRNFVLLFILVIIFFTINVYFGILVAFWLICFALTIHYWTNKISKQAELSQQIQDEISGFMVDDFMNIQNIKMFSSVTKERMKLSNLLKKKIEKLKKIGNYVSLSNLIIFSINYLTVATIMLCSAKMFIEKTMDLGTFFFVIELSRRICVFSQYFGHEAKEAFKNVAIIREGLSMITNEPEIKDKKEAKKLENMSGKIIFKNIYFKY